MDLQLLEKKVKERLQGEATGHDMHHVLRVRSMAKRLAQMENCPEAELCEAMALLHDIPDRKLHPNPELGMQEVKAWLLQAGASSTEVSQVLQAIAEVSYRGAQVQTPMSTLAGKILQDADRLDALGAIGIARCFAYGGSRKRPLYDPEVTPEMHTSAHAYYSAEGSSLAHFYEKLLLLKDRMQTKSGQIVAQSRHDYLEKFLAQFLKEWNATDVDESFVR
jgi:uncharacterized protein